MVWYGKSPCYAVLGCALPVHRYAIRQILFVYFVVEKGWKVVFILILYIIFFEPYSSTAYYFPIFLIILSQSVLSNGFAMMGDCSPCVFPCHDEIELEVCRIVSRLVLVRSYD